MAAVVAGAMGAQMAAKKSPSTALAQQSHLSGNRVGSSLHSLCRGVEKLGVAPLRHKKRLAKLSTSSAGRRATAIVAQAVSSDEAASAEQSMSSFFFSLSLTTSSSSSSSSLEHSSKAA